MKGRLTEDCRALRESLKSCHVATSCREQGYGMPTALETTPIDDILAAKYQEMF
jgi:hypothetical protein